jgi:hypothetical protein
MLCEKIDAADVGAKMGADPLTPSDGHTAWGRIPVFSTRHASSRRVMRASSLLPAPLESRRTPLAVIMLKQVLRSTMNDLGDQHEHKAKDTNLCSDLRQLISHL